MITSKLTSKAQTTIPQPVRRALALQPGDDLEYELREDGVLLRRATERNESDPFAHFDEWNSPEDEQAYAER